MSFQLDPSLPIKIAIVNAAHSAMATAVVSEGQALDLSRLTLLGFSIQSFNRPGPATTVGYSFSQTKDCESGQLFLAKITFSDESRLFAQVDFEILNRKRGLSTRDLQMIQTPDLRIGPKSKKFEIKLEEIGSQKSKLAKKSLDGEFWPIEAIFEAACAESPDPQSTEFSINFRLFDAARAALPCEIKTGISGQNDRLITEISQNNCLIAQLIENTLL